MTTEITNVNKNLKIRYIYDNIPRYTNTEITYNKVPVACVIRDGDHYGIAVKNPCDKRFIKQRAVEIAHGRASKNCDLSTNMVPNKRILIKTKSVPVQIDNKILLPFKQVSLKEAIEYAISKLQRIKNA